MKRIFVAVLLLTFLFGCVARQDVINLDHRLSTLETENAQLKNQLEKIGKNRVEEDQELRSQSASLHARIDRLKEEVKILGGNIEEIDHNLKKKTATAEQAIQEIRETLAYHNERFLKIERYLNLEPLEMPQKPAAQEQPDVSPDVVAERPQGEISENEIYTLAKQAFDLGEFEKSRKHFETLLEKYPNSPRADNAQFWIGETYYRERWYEKAILEYQKVIEKFPNGNKVAASLLKQGFAFFNLGDKPNARLILKELVKKYPNSNEASVARQKLSEF